MKKKSIVTAGLMMILLLVGCGGGDASETGSMPSASTSEAAPDNTVIPDNTATAVSESVPTDVPTAVPTDVPTIAPTAVPTISPTPIPTEESVDLASCIIGTWDYVNLQEAMQAMITSSMPPEVAEQVAITGVNGRLFIIFGTDGTASAGAEDLIISMAIMDTETETAVEAVGSIAYNVDGDTLATDLTDYVSTGTDSVSSGIVVFDIATMLPAGETAEAISTFSCEGNSMQITNPNLPIPLQLQRINQ